MRDDIEDYQYSNHSDINFVYDEKPAKKVSSHTQDDEENSQERKTEKMPGVFLAAVVLIILLLFVMIWWLWGERDVNPEETSKMPDETGTEEISTDESQVSGIDWKEQLAAYMTRLYRNSDIQYVTENGTYMPHQGLLLELNGNDAYQEGVILRWDEEGQHYSLFTFRYNKSEQGKNTIDEQEYAFKSEQARKGQIDAINVIFNQKDDLVDLILSKHGDEGENSSIFMRYLKGVWICLGTVDGTLVSDSTGEEALQLVDTEDIYCVRGNETFFDLATYTYWWVVENALQSDSQISLNKTYMTLSGAPEWYLRRPVAAYAQVDMEMDETQVILLQGTTIHLVGVLKWGEAAYFLVETDTGDTGYILLEHPEKGASCQVKLQSLPFDEVFSESPVEAESISEDAYTSFLPVIRNGMMQTVLPGEEYSAWTDLNGDGIYEKLIVKITKANMGEGYVTTTARILLDDIIIGNTAQGNEELQLFILDLNPCDQWMEIGYTYEQRYTDTKIFRYDGVNMRSLELPGYNIIGGNRTLDLEALIYNEGGMMESVTVYGDCNGYAYKYDISLQPETGMFSMQPVTECKMDDIVSSRAWESAVLYDSPGGEELRIVSSDEKLSLVSIYVDFRDDADGKIYGCFQMENGDYGYSETFDYTYSMQEVFDLTELFGPMAG